MLTRLQTISPVCVLFCILCARSNEGGKLKYMSLSALHELALQGAYLEIGLHCSTVCKLGPILFPQGVKLCPLIHVPTSTIPQGSPEFT